MRGLELMIKTIVQSLGLKIDPTQIEQAWEQSKDALPKLGKAFDEMNARQAEILERQKQLENLMRQMEAKYEIVNASHREALHHVA
jgi:predicted outer membrane protein